MGRAIDGPLFAREYQHTRTRFIGGYLSRINISGNAEILLSQRRMLPFCRADGKNELKQRKNGHRYRGKRLGNGIQC